jgi:hypothetical protein
VTASQRVAQGEHRDIAVSQLCSLSGASMTTALRHIEQLERENAELREELCHAQSDRQREHDLRCTINNENAELIKSRDERYAEYEREIFGLTIERDRLIAALTAEGEKHKATFETMHREKLVMFCEIKDLATTIRELADASMQRILRPDDSEATLRLFKANQRAQELLS